MLYQVTIKEKNIYSENRAEAASAPIVRLFYEMKHPAAEIVSIGAPQTEAKPGQPYYNINLPAITNIYRLHRGYILIIFEDGNKFKLTDYTSERADNIELLKAIQSGDTSATDEAKSDARDLFAELEREIEKAKNDDGETCYTCPNCGEEIEESELEAVSMYDYLADALDVEYIVNSNKEFQSVKICVAWGGPGIYIDTDKKAVCLYWWGDSAFYSMSSEAVEAVDEWAQEYFDC